jgi:predicted DCC family thiol-disulfide oxidoreductase YuxK
MPPIIIFDGYCNYCNRMVNFAISNDPKAKLRFTANQSPAGQELVEKFKIGKEIESVILIEGDRVSFYSTAAVRIARYLKWPAKCLYAFIVIPAFLRDPLYRLIARNRYKWFGKRETCRIPTEEEKQRFL